MPFTTYTITDSLIQNLDRIKNSNLNKFISTIENINLKKRAIYVDKSQETIVQAIRKSFLKVSNANQSLEDNIQQEFLEQILKIINESYYIKNKNISSFVKDFTNEIPKETISESLKEDFDFTLYRDVDDFKENFLNKIKIFVQVENQKNKKIDKIYIFHKELSNYLSKYFYLNNGKYDELNAKKIYNGVSLFCNWVKNFPDDTIPNEIVIFTDKPKRINENIDALQAKMQNFLFKDIGSQKFKCLVKIKRIFDRDQWWKHKRHIVFGDDISLLIRSDFGIELIDLHNKNKLNQENIFTIISHDSPHIHKNDIKKFIKGLKNIK